MLDRSPQISEALDAVGRGVGRTREGVEILSVLSLMGAQIRDLTEEVEQLKADAP